MKLEIPEYPKRQIARIKTKVGRLQLQQMF